jgi:glycosyltransferase involved in cell wall biosynthesis
MRTLVVATEYPWPLNSGSRRRLSNTLQGLSQCGPTELFSAVSEGRTDFAPPPASVPLERVERIAIDDRPPGPADVARCLVRPSIPFEMPVRARNTVSPALRRFATGHYDLVWFFQVRAWVLADQPGLAPDVVDIDDLEDEKILARMALPRRNGERQGFWRHEASRQWAAEDVRRWRRLHRLVARRASASVVCSELDARRSALPGVRVIANGYPPPDRPAGRPSVSSPPTVVFQGTLRYPPNADAARYLVEDIGPRLRALVPAVQIRLVGLAPPTLASLGDPPAVIVTGQVDDIADELARADIIVIPLRYGSGTRVKILEAFAHRIPVVSTTIGAEGLEVESGTHLLVADDPGGLAQACARLLGDDILRRAIVDQAHALYMARYRSSVVEDEIGALAREVAAR